MNKIFLLIGLALLCTSEVYSQLGMGKPKDIRAIKERTLIVVTEEIDYDLVRKLEKKGLSEEYTECINNTNRALIEGSKAARSTFHGIIRIMKASEFEAITESRKKNSGYAYVRLLGYTNHWAEAVRGYDSRDGESTRSLSISLTEKSMAVYNVWLPFYEPSKADIIFGFQQIGNYFDLRTKAGVDKREILSSMNDNASLSDKTLLIDIASLKHVLTAEQIKSVYPYKFDIVDRTFIEEQIEGFSSEYVYLQVLPHLIILDAAGHEVSSMYDGLTRAGYDFYQLVYDAKNGEVVGHTYESSLPGTYLKSKITLANIQNIVKK